MSQTVKRALEGGGFLAGNVSSRDLTTPEDIDYMHHMIAKTTKDFVETEVVPKLAALEAHDFEEAVQLFREAGELGLLAADVSEKYGGIGLDQVGSALITEHFSRAEGFAVAQNIHVGVGTLPIVYFGNDAQKQRYLPQIANGQRVAAYALTEPGAGSDALSGKSSAVLNEAGTHYILNGEKQWITNASIADVFIVFAQVEREHFTAFIVERSSAGLSTGPEERKMGIHSCSTATLNLDDVSVPKENVIWEVGKGHLVALNILNIARYKLGVLSLGQAKKALRLAAEYANERYQFGKPIAALPLIQEKLADMAVHLYAVESTLYRTSGLLEQSLGGLSDEEEAGPDEAAERIGEYKIECALNKFHASEALDHVVDEALQIHGGYGFMQEYAIENMYRDARIDRIFEGTNEINRMAAARGLIKKMREDESFAAQMTLGGEEATEAVEKQAPQSDVLIQEKEMGDSAKKIFRETFVAAFHTYGKALEAEQELLSRIADMMAEVYAIDSVVGRTEKNILREGTEKHTQKLNLTKVFCEESLERMVVAAKKVLGRLQDNETLDSIYTAYLKYGASDCVDKKREIAAKLLEEEAYTV